MQPVYKIAVPVFVEIEVRSKPPIDKNVRQIRKSEKEPEIETVDEQRQDILRSNAFESLRRAVMVNVLLFEPRQQVVPAVLPGKFLPKRPHLFERLRPPHMP